MPIAPLPAAGMLPMLTSAGEVRPLEELESEIIRFAISRLPWADVRSGAAAEDPQLDALSQTR